ncbi:MAG: PCRF domain-containing protein, partial [Euzebyaceae bacterium]|nr:PCRF domain-containing protein [Euzebyaceae bacterium]
MADIFSRLDELERAHAELTRDLADPAVLGDGGRYTATAKRHAELSEVVSAYDEYRRARGDVQAARELAKELGQGEDVQTDRDLLRAEAEQMEARAEALTRRLQLLLIPKDPLDDKNVIVEIRAGAGGDEASIWAGDLFRMLTKYAERRGFTVELLEISEGAYTFAIKGDSAYSVFKYEGGTHRVQRVPATESQGRVHTST